MKRIKIFLLPLLWTVLSCEDGVVNLDVPRNLVSEVTATKAVLSWDEVAGAKRYNVKINDGEIITVSLNSYVATGLSPETEYSWQVQACGDGMESAWSGIEVFSTVEISLSAPFGLNAEDVTDRNAVLIWETGDSEVRDFEVRFGEDMPVSVKGTHYAVSGLSPDTKYTWTVRAVDGERKGEWAVPTTFSTRPVQFVEAELKSYSASSGFVIDFHTYYAQFDQTGYNLEINMITGAVDDGTDVKYLDIPEGRYELVPTGEKNTAHSEFTWLYEYENGYPKTRFPVEGGEVEVEKEGDTYRMSFNMELEGGQSFVAEYNGTLSLRNPGYEMPVEDRDYGTFYGITQFEYFPGAYQQSDAWVISAYDGDVWVENGELKGNGTILRMQIHTESGSGMPMPDGTYTICRGGYPWTALASDCTSGGMMISPLENGKIIMEETVHVVSGTLVSLYDEAVDEYTIDVNGTSSRGENVKISVQGYEVTTVL